MTSEELLSVAEIVEKLTDRFNAQAALHLEHEYDKLIASMNADHEAKMVEHRAAFGARTEADAKIIAGLRAEIASLKREELATNETLKPLVDRVVTERDALRAEVAALQERLRSSIARGDFAQMEVAELKSQTPKHPWTFANCEPCDQPATHDTEAGKAAAESAVRTEPVADEIKIGNVVKVCSASGDNTARSDIGKIGEVIEIDSQDGTVLLSGGAGWVSRCDVRKVTT